MIDIIEDLGRKNPRYSMKYRKLIEGFARKGAIDYHESGEKSYDLGKFFTNFYEFYLYASFIGLYIDNPLPLSKDFETATFKVPMRDWTSNDSAPTVHYLWMATIVESGLDLNNLENMEDKDVEREMRGIKDRIEAYANGGFDFITSKVDENPAFFDDDDCFVKLLKEVE
ncbi:hypothetical protein SLH46_06250 [Draconibacterium sp. IB214405]|uniref:hypothetical protein n=1 Tax=Draconibacterium sp. IB214405 TaxID=3097352 RepID=UPI002A1783B6|nr:hypothetical protein [Draconibacterium sp. IB214405]MDX8338773.1 hypothetical protein [Draconibacterium sp. IB214405]